MTGGLEFEAGRDLEIRLRPKALSVLVPSVDPKT